MLLWTTALAAALGGGAAVGALRWLRRRGVDPALAATLLRQSARRATVPASGAHVLICVADHYEPLYGRPPRGVARARVARWLRDYPRQFGRLRDSDGRPPRHSFFYPLEEYQAEHLDALAELCRQGFGEVEVHLHHDGDTAEGLARALADYRQLLAEQHGLLSFHRDTGRAVYGFIHGNWALCNSRPDGRWCGVNEELDVLRETGCYADFTMPSAPHPTQTRTVNRIYYARNVPGRPRSHEWGVDVGTGPAPADGLMLIQGPLALNWRLRKWQVVPRLENGCVQASQPATLDRLPLWIKARVQVPTRPDWYFVKLHCHGAPEDAHEALLGRPMVAFHEALARYAADNPWFHYHYVTAREMYNLARAAEAGWTGSVAGALDYELIWNGDSEALLHRSRLARREAAGEARPISNLAAGEAS
jgi:hypothetical protein